MIKNLYLIFLASLINSSVDFLKSKGTTLGSDRWLWGGYTFWNESAGATSNTTGAHFHVY